MNCLPLQHSDSVKYLTFPHIEVRHAFSTRQGGVSEGAYSSLNLGYTVGDCPDRVGENRRRFARCLGVDDLPWLLSMDHGVEVARIDQVSAIEGQQSEGRRIPADACMTSKRNIPLSVTVADCVPVIFYDPRTQVAAVAHAGWRGTVNGIVARTIEAMVQAYGAQAWDIRVGIGPSIGPSSFEVGAEVAAEFTKAFPESTVVRPHPHPLEAAEGKAFVDLWQANRRMALSVGVLDSHIQCAQRCTMKEADLFFSHRRDRGKTGRLLAAIVL